MHLIRTDTTGDDITDRMQIWRTARSAPWTSRMKARLVRLCSFVLTMLFQKSLASLSIWSLCFVIPPRFCVPECHRNIVKSSTAEKVLYFRFPRSPLRGNQRDGGKEFTIAEGTVKQEYPTTVSKKIHCTVCLTLPECRYFNLV